MAAGAEQLAVVQVQPGYFINHVDKVYSPMTKDGAGRVFELSRMCEGAALLPAVTCHIVPWSVGHDATIGTGWRCEVVG
ncbi:hypothetical protein GCM10027422_27920 [Hymenobacter arcticus]